MYLSAGAYFSLRVPNERSRFSYHSDPCKNDGDPEFLCDNGRCIYSELECDDRDSCGDGSDEREGEPTNCPPGNITNLFVYI